MVIPTCKVHFISSQVNEVIWKHCTNFFEKLSQKAVSWIQNRVYRSKGPRLLRSIVTWSQEVFLTWKKYFNHKDRHGFGVDYTTFVEALKKVSTSAKSYNGNSFQIRWGILFLNPIPCTSFFPFHYSISNISNISNSQIFGSPRPFFLIFDPYFKFPVQHNFQEGCYYSSPL